MKVHQHFKYYISIILIATAVALNSQYISVDTENYTKEQLVKNIFFGAQTSGCISVDNIQINGHDFRSGPKSWGYFNRNGSTFEMNEGIILSTGNAQEAIGPNTTLQSITVDTWLGDDDLENALSIRNTHNATILEFDFTATSDYITKISFDYLFASEQYLRRIDTGLCSYTDGFAFLIREDGSTTYRNLAVIPGTTIPIKSNTVRGGGEYCPAINEEYFGHYNYDSPTNFNGQTKILRAITDIVPHQKYHLKLVIADQGNGLYDSGVFLKAGSFVGIIDLGPDLLISTNNSICEGSTKILDATTPGATSYQWFKDGVAISGETNARLSIFGLPSSNGNYEVEVHLGGCILKGSIQVEIQPKPIVNPGIFDFCDEFFTGNIPITFSTINPQIITNYNSSFIVKYYLNPIDQQNGTPNFLADNWSFATNTTVYIRIENTAGCPVVFGQINFTIGSKIPLINNSIIDSVCDDLLNGKVDIDLNIYKSKFSTDPTVISTFYNTEIDAKNNQNSVPSNQTLTTSKTFYIRLENGSDCPNISVLTLNIKSPKKSTVLKDEKICPTFNVNLDAGSGFDSYQWSTGEISQTINVGVGSYYVDLGYNGCVYRQNVQVTAAELPMINNVDVTGNTAIVSVRGGNPPYQYSLDNINFQPSNLFANIPRGLQTIYVKDAQNCETITKEFLVLNLINVITPNDDGKNDVLDYSDLSIKKEVKIEIYDRYGNQVFISQKTPYIWDGKMNGRALSTGTYWYILNWIEPDTNLPVTFKGWILLKNRN